MRYYNAIIEENLTYKRGLKKAKKMNLALTRPSEWDGFHIILGEDYFILLKNGQAIIYPKEVLNIKSKDWAIVKPTKRAIAKLKNITEEAE